MSCRALFDNSGNMASEGGSDSQLRRRRRRDTGEPEKTELGERELTVVVAVAQENEEENEERWVGPLPVEATLAKKRKGSYSDRHRASWNLRPQTGKFQTRLKNQMVCACGVFCPQNRGSASVFWSFSTSTFSPK